MVIDIPLPHWRPDAADINNPGLKRANNCTPSMGNANGTVTYLPMMSAALYAPSSLDSPSRGLMTGTDSLGNAHVYTGTTSGLYHFDASTQSWANVSGPGGYTTTEQENWESIQYASSIITTNFSVSAVSVPLGPLLSEHDWSCEKASRRIWKLNYG